MFQLFGLNTFSENFSIFFLYYTYVKIRSLPPLWRNPTPLDHDVNKLEYKLQGDTFHKLQLLGLTGFRGEDFNRFFLIYIQIFNFIPIVAKPYHGDHDLYKLKSTLPDDASILI